MDVHARLRELDAEHARILGQLRNVLQEARAVELLLLDGLQARVPSASSSRPIPVKVSRKRRPSAKKPLLPANDNSDPVGSWREDGE